MENKKCRQT